MQKGGLFQHTWFLLFSAAYLTTTLREPWVTAQTSSSHSSSGGALVLLTKLPSAHSSETWVSLSVHTWAEASGFAPLGFQGSLEDSWAPADRCIPPHVLVSQDFELLLSIYLCWRCFKGTEHLSGDSSGTSEKSLAKTQAMESAPLLLHPQGTSSSMAKPRLFLCCWSSVLSHGPLAPYSDFVLQYPLAGTLADEGLANPAALQAQNSYRKLLSLT